MVQEQLACHEVEWEVMKSPSQDGHTDFVVEALEGDIVVVTETTLPSEDSEPFNRNVENDERGGSPPNDCVSVSKKSSIWGPGGIRTWISQ